MAVWRSRTSGGGVGQGADPSAPVEPPAGTARTKAPEKGVNVANIGKSITIRGDVSGEEDLIIEGRVEGRVELAKHHLTVGPNGHIEAEIVAKEVTIIGRVSGNVTATERTEIQESGRLDGDLVAPRLLIQEGAQINGGVTMKSPSAVPSGKGIPQAELQPPSEQAG
jgi:cytoskeletal protein CcmA (bactofilin family)